MHAIWHTRAVFRDVIPDVSTEHHIFKSRFRQHLSGMPSLLLSESNRWHDMLHTSAVACVKAVSRNHCLKSTH